MESERPDALFRDPYARRLAGARGAQILASLPRGHTWAWPMIVRTAVMDQLIPPAIERAGAGTGPHLPPGPDARPHQPPPPPPLRWVGPDIPARIAPPKETPAAGPPPC